MVIVGKDVQKKLLRALRELNGCGTIPQIRAIVQTVHSSCYNGLTFLTNRGLVTKTVIFTKAKRRVPPHQHNTYHLKPEKMEKINRLISEIRDD